MPIDPSVTPFVEGMTTHEADVHNSICGPIIAGESGTAMTAGSCIVSSKDHKEVVGEPKTYNEVTHASIRSHWDVEEVQVLLDYYMGHVTQDLQKRGVPLVMLNCFC